MTPATTRTGTAVGEVLARTGDGAVKGATSMADPPVVEPGSGDRRAAGRGGGPPAGGLRGLLGGVREELFRPLAGDDARVAYWVRHVRNGVVLTEVAALTSVVYVLFTDSPGRHHPLLLTMGVLVLVTVPALLLLPIPAMMRDSRGPTMLYLWSISTSVFVVVSTRLDGGPSSPLDALLFLNLGYMAIAYSPHGVLAIGSFTTVAYLLVVALPGLTVAGVFFLTILGAFTTICALASGNSWAAYDRQVELVRMHETLAATDPLTGIPNRRAFLERLAAAIAGAEPGRRTAVCLVDLDGFKNVNDTAGHAAGDAVLQAVSAALGAGVRESDTVARLGGDEFAVLADVSGGTSAEQLAERLCRAVATVGRAAGVTASVGVTEVAVGDDVEDLMYRVDVAMYRAKSAGGDRATVPAC